MKRPSSLSHMLLKLRYLRQKLKSTSKSRSSDPHKPTSSSKTQKPNKNGTISQNARSHHVCPPGGRYGIYRPPSVCTCIGCSTMFGGPTPPPILTFGPFAGLAGTLVSGASTAGPYPPSHCRELVAGLYPGGALPQLSPYPFPCPPTPGT